MAQCVVCGRGPTDKPPVTVYRQNPTGQAGIWACELHATAPVDPEVKAIVTAIEEDPDGDIAGADYPPFGSI